MGHSGGVHPRKLLLPLAAACALLLSLTVTVMLIDRGGRGRAPEAGVPTESPEVVVGAPVPEGAKRASSDQRQARVLLAAWDRDRAAAWAAGDRSALASLYTDSSMAGRADLALLGRYVARGFTVEGMQSQVLDFAVASRRADRLEIVLTDRVIDAVAVSGTQRRALPSGRAERRRIVFVRQAEGWVVGEVSSAPAQP